MHFAPSPSSTFRIYLRYRVFHENHSRILANPPLMEFLPLQCLRPMKSTLFLRFASPQVRFDFRFWVTSYRFTPSLDPAGLISCQQHSWGFPFRVCPYQSARYSLETVSSLVVATTSKTHFDIGLLTRSFAGPTGITS